MIKIYQKYLVKLFCQKILLISAIFLFLTLILSIFEEINFFKDMNVKFYIPLLLTVLNAPSVIFDIFPFIYLIATQLFFIHLINKEELELLKINGLSNFKILKLTFFTSVFLGILTVAIFYSFSAKMKFFYLELKNDYSNDNKYLASVSNNGLWIKDEINDKILIINAAVIKNNNLLDIEITQFNKNFELEKVISSAEANIKNNQWIIKKPIISQNNQNIILKENMILNTHFNIKKIKTLFDNLTSLNIMELYKLKKDKRALGYTTDNVVIHLYKIFTYPIFLAFMSALSGILMLNITRKKPLIFHIISGIFLSVLIYYFIFIFSVLGENGKLPLFLSASFPLIIIMFFLIFGLVRINEK